MSGKGGKGGMIRGILRMDNGVGLEINGLAHFEKGDSFARFRKSLEKEI
jgi:hypothetical protein